MTTFETTRSATAPLSLGAMIATLFGNVRAWNDARVTRNSLNKLTLRELEDIGLTRADIDAVAQRGARY